jgi:hypothetical protein
VWEWPTDRQKDGGTAKEGLKTFPSTLDAVEK